MPVAISRRCLISAVSFGAGGAGGARRRRASKGPSWSTPSMRNSSNRSSMTEGSPPSAMTQGRK
eukprot:15317999-Alexandrium_andersonii.AAC.1